MKTPIRSKQLLSYRSFLKMSPVFALFFTSGIIYAGTAAAGFTENKGQLCDQNGKPVPDVLFRGNMKNAPGIFITEKGLTYLFSETPTQKFDPTAEPKAKDKKWSKMEMILEGASIKKNNVIAEEPLDGISNYYLANCPNGILDVRTFKKITIKNVYKGIDWVICSNEKNNMEYDLVVNPGADPSQIKIKYKGADKMLLSENDTRLNLISPCGKLFEGNIFSYEKETAETISSYYKKNKNVISFALANYDKTKTLVIDPPLQWTAIQTGSGNDYAYAIAAAKDGSGKSFITGYTDSPDYPTMNAYQGTLSGPEDMIVTCLNSAGVKLWSTYYGGTDIDGGKGIAADANGYCYVTGYTASTNFPTANPIQVSFGGGTYDVVILKFNSAGARQWATYFGGVTDDHGMAVASDNAGNIFVTGYTNSTNFPLKHAIQTVKNTGYDSFIMKFLPTGILSWSDYMGSNDDDKGRGICLNAAGTDVYFTGSTLSGANFSTNGVFQFINGSPFTAEDAFITEFDTSGQTKIFCTFCGGNDIDIGQGIAVDGAGKIFITGYTLSPNFPTVNPGGAAYYDNTIGSPATHDAFVVACNANGTTELWGTYFGGSGVDMGLAINYDPTAGIYITGSSASTDLPVMMPVDNNFYQAVQGDGGNFNDAFIAWFYPNYSQQWTTYAGGANDDEGFGISTDASGNIYVAGITNNDAVAAKYAHGVLNSVSTIDEDLSVSVFPDPASDQLTIDNKQSTKGEIILMDVSGKEILREEMIDQKTTIDISKFASGIYFVKITSEEKTYVKKFVKE